MNILILGAAVIGSTYACQLSNVGNELVLPGMIIERVTGGCLSTYLQEKIWKTLGMGFPASGRLDSQQCGMEKRQADSTLARLISPGLVASTCVAVTGTENR